MKRPRAARKPCDPIPSHPIPSHNVTPITRLCRLAVHPRTTHPCMTHPRQVVHPWGRYAFPKPTELALSDSVLDVVKVPMVKPGKYVVGFRYDCDATAQVWSNCADITIV